jgi:anti-anti-sigma factor
VEPVFEVDAGAVNGEVLVRFVGELDMAGIEDAHDRVVEVLDAHPKGPLILDLHGLTFCDSSGISELLMLKRVTIAQDRKLVLREIHPNVARVLEALGLSEQFVIED